MVLAEGQSNRLVEQNRDSIIRPKHSDYLISEGSPLKLNRKRTVFWEKKFSQVYINTKKPIIPILYYLKINSSRIVYLNMIGY